MKHLFLIVFTTLSLIFYFVKDTQAQQPKTKVTLGVKLDYFYSNDEGGVKAKDVIKDRAAEKAGIQADDIIIALDQHKIKGLFHYKDVLSEYSSGDKVIVKVKRDDKVLYFNVQFE